ncbi:hypothetical protein IJL65_01000 [bacterium]|nr:hypothetical protein [bacterium]
MKKELLSKLHLLKPKKGATTKLWVDDDSIINLKAFPLPVKDAEENLTAVLNEKIARAYGITPSDKIYIIKSN